jgi:hypothetical protein
MVATCSSETSVEFQRTTRRYISEDINLQSKYPPGFKARDDVQINRNILGDRRSETLYAVMQNLLSSGFPQMPRLFHDAFFLD